MGRFADVPDLFFPPPLPAPPLRLGDPRPALGCFWPGAHSPVKAAAPLAGLGANLASATSAGLSAAQRALASREDERMGRKRFKPEEIVAKLRQVEVLQSQGMAAADANEYLISPTCESSFVIR